MRFKHHSKTRRTDSCVLYRYIHQNNTNEFIMLSFVSKESFPYARASKLKLKTINMYICISPEPWCSAENDGGHTE